MMFPKPQSGLGWPSIVVFNANNDGGVHLGKKIFRGPIQGPKIPLKPPKMAILRPNLNDGVLPRDNGEVLLWQYTQVSSTSSQSTLPIEDIEHALTQCVGTSDTRRAKLHALLSLAATAKSTVNIEKISSNNSTGLYQLQPWQRYQNICDVRLSHHTVHVGCWFISQGIGAEFMGNIAVLKWMVPSIWLVMMVP